MRSERFTQLIPEHVYFSRPGCTHSSAPSDQVSRFQMGTTSFKVSMSQRQASNASLRWGQLTATTTLISPRSR